MKKLIIVLIAFISFISAHHAQATSESAKQERPKHGYRHSHQKKDYHRKGVQLFHRHAHDQSKGHSKADDNAHTHHRRNHGEKERSNAK